MQQRKLRLDDLQVESFHVLPEAPEQRGTVAAREAAETFGLVCRPSFTCFVSCRLADCSLEFTCDTCQETCRGLDTCDPSCLGTCDVTCETCLCTDEFQICGFTD